MAIQRFKEGDWFAVPLANGTSALGLIARYNGRDGILGYYFPALSEDVVTPADLSDLSPADAVLIGITGYLGLRKGKWPVLGQHEIWDRAAWPMPAFKRYQELNDKTYRVIRDEGTLAAIADVEVSRDFSGPEDGSMGFGFVEARLSRLLAR